MALRKEEFHYNPDEKKSMEQAQSARQQRITINVSFELYEQMKFRAYQRNQSLNEYIGDVLHQAFPNQPGTGLQAHALTSEIYQNILAARQQILRDTNGQLFEDSTELIRQMREERAKELGER